MTGERRKTDRRVPPAVVEYSISAFERMQATIAEQAREIERLKTDISNAFNDDIKLSTMRDMEIELAALKAQPSGVVPEELFDGFAVYSAMTDQAKRRTSGENVSDALNAVVKLIRARLNSYPVSSGEPFQLRVLPWLLECFGAEIANDTVERNHRFLEEALELVQACGCPADEAHKLVDYVYGRPVGEKSQEVGGVMVTLAALCLAQGLDMHLAGETELARITQPAMVERIREKQKRKPAMSPLPGVYPERAAVSAGGVDERTAFEDWYAARSFEGMAGNNRFERSGGEYWYIGTRKSWDAWQARAALTASAPNHSEQVREVVINPDWVMHMLSDRWPESSERVEVELLADWLRDLLAAAPSAGSQGGDV